MRESTGEPLAPEAAQVPAAAEPAVSIGIGPALAGPAPATGRLDAAAVLRLQRSAGNGAVARMLAAGDTPRITPSGAVLARDFWDDVGDAASAVADTAGDLAEGAAEGATQAWGAATGVVEEVAEDAGQ